MRARGWVGLLAAAVLAGAAMVGVTAPAAGAAPIPIGGNPTPGTDLFASLIAPLTGGTQRICATSGLGIPVHCVEHTLAQPSADPAAFATTFAHWVFCKGNCGGALPHEMVHVRQFETHGDFFGPMYLVEAAQHGDGCANKYEREAYESTGGCP